MTDDEAKAASPDFLVHMRRPDGREYWLRIPPEHWDRVMALTQGEFADPSIQLSGPRLPPLER